MGVINAYFCLVASASEWLAILRTNPRPPTDPQHCSALTKIHSLSLSLQIIGHFLELFLAKESKVIFVIVQMSIFLKLPHYLLKSASRLWGPFLSPGIRVTKVSPDFREIEARMKLRWYNKSPIGAHYGGSLYSLTDGFFVLILVSNIGNKHYIWDKAGSIEYVQPGRTEVHANFKLSAQELDRIVEKASDGNAHFVDFDVNVLDAADNIVAKVKKTVYVKRKPDIEEIRTCERQ